VNTASLNGLMSFKTLGSLAHTTAKAGIIGMTRQLAMPVALRRRFASALYYRTRKRWPSTPYRFEF